MALTITSVTTGLVKNPALLATACRNDPVSSRSLVIEWTAKNYPGCVKRRILPRLWWMND